jgi:hypothetical protein
MVGSYNASPNLSGPTSEETVLGWAFGLFYFAFKKTFSFDIKV